MDIDYANIPHKSFAAEDNAMDQSDDLNFWLTICGILTIIFYSLFGVIFFLVKRIVVDAFNQVMSKRLYRPRVGSLSQFSTPAITTGVTQTRDRLEISLSIRKTLPLLILRNTPLIDFHKAMVSSTRELLVYLRNFAVETQYPTTTSINLKVDESRIPLDQFRSSYDLVLAFVDEEALDDSPAKEEKVVVAFSIIHVKQHAEERRPTQILFSYCKTNKDRLICVRGLYTTGGGDALAHAQPDCVICLSERAADVAFVPCRHVVMCRQCLPAFQASSNCLHCPLCRCGIAEINLLR